MPVVVTAYDAYGNIDTNYSDTIDAISSDGQTIPSEALVDGTYTYTNLSYSQAGSVTISVSGPPDPASSYPNDRQPSSTIVGSGLFSVVPGSSDGETLTLTPSAAAVPLGGSVSFTLVIRDQFGNNVLPALTQEESGSTVLTGAAPCSTSARGRTTER